MSERELAYIATIKSISPIPGLDKIEKAEILGWEIVVRKNEFAAGDLCVYCEIDSIFPELPCFEFLRPRKFRIKTFKLKGQISQGIAFPLSILTDVDPTFDLSSVKVGDDVSEALKITKHDPEAASDIDLEPQVKKSWLANQFSYYKWKLFGIKKNKHVNGFPSDVPKTDEVRVQKMGSVIERLAGTPVYIAEKCEGSSVSFIFRQQGNWIAKLFGHDYLFQACSRNRVVFSSNKKVISTHNTAKLNDKYQIETKMKALGRNIAIQGECIGPKIQGNVYRLPEVEVRFFSVYDLDTQSYLPYQELVWVLVELDLPMVPVIDYQATLNADVKYYVDLSKGKSAINKSKLREGIVVRSLDSSLSFKSINPEYLLKQKDELEEEAA